MEQVYIGKRMIIVSVCRKCGKETTEEEMPMKNTLDNRRGKRSSDKICSECN